MWLVERDRFAAAKITWDQRPRAVVSKWWLRVSRDRGGTGNRFDEGGNGVGTHASPSAPLEASVTSRKP
jgi:hypothetical protein